MKHTRILAAAAAATALLVACATAPSPADYDKAAAEVMKASFREQGIAKLDRIRQDELQQACSCLLYTSPSPRDGLLSRMPSSA